MIQLIVDGIINDEDNNEGSRNDMELAVNLLLWVSIPSLYPLDKSTTLTFDIAYVFATNRKMEYAPDKPLKILLHLDATKLKESLAE